MSFLFVFGSYGGFFITKGYNSLHVCLGWFAFTIFLYDVEDAMGSIMNQNLWKSIHDELPKEGEKVLILVDGEEMRTGYYNKENGMIEDERVSHWMPLPEKPS